MTGPRQILDFTPVDINDYCFFCTSRTLQLEFYEISISGGSPPKKT